MREGRDPTFEVLGSKFRKPRTSNPRLSRSSRLSRKAILLGLCPDFLYLASEEFPHRPLHLSPGSLDEHPTRRTFPSGTSLATHAFKLMRVLCLCCGTALIVVNVVAAQMIGNEVEMERSRGIAEEAMSIDDQEGAAIHIGRRRSWPNSLPRPS